MVWAKYSLLKYLDPLGMSYTLVLKFPLRLGPMYLLCSLGGGESI